MFRSIDIKCKSWIFQLATHDVDRGMVEEAL